jgi:hypothetical protein
VVEWRAALVQEALSSHLGGYGSQAHLAAPIHNLIVRHAETTASCANCCLSKPMPPSTALRGVAVACLRVGFD